MAQHKAHQAYVFSDFPPESGYLVSVPSLLFNLPSYIQTKNLPGLKSYSIWNKQSRSEAARICLSIIDEAVISLPASPFGSLEIFESLSDEILIDFIRFLTERHHDLTIYHYPNIYKKFSFSDDVFLKAGLKLYSEAIGHYLKIEEDFEQHISGMELRKIKSAERDGLMVTQLGLERFEEVFQFIEQCRKSKGQMLSLDQKALQNQLITNPESYLLFAVFVNQQMVAATIAVWVSKEVVYHFYPATRADFKKYSPMVLLTKGLYDFCLRSEIKFLDLGTSMLNNLPNQSLIHFKEQLGGKPYQKSTFKTRI